MNTSDEFRTYAMLVKPVSSVCNLRCEYCYYTGKQSTLHIGSTRMSGETLETYIRQNLDMHGRKARVEFAWHGGEPTLAGLAFYQKALRLQQQYGQGRTIVNTMQTNASLLSDDFCSFFKDAGFLIGVSIDGPEKYHNAYRKTADGKGSFSLTMRGIELLQKHGVSFNTLTTVNRVNQEAPAEVYAFLRELTDWMQFLPVVESRADDYEKEDGQLFAVPPGIYGIHGLHSVTAFSVTSEGYGSFLCGVFDQWKKGMPGRSMCS